MLIVEWFICTLIGINEGLGVAFGSLFRGTVLCRRGNSRDNVAALFSARKVQEKPAAVPPSKAAFFNEGTLLIEAGSICNN